MVKASPNSWRILDEDMDDINMKLIKKAFITENEKAWNREI